MKRIWITTLIAAALLSGCHAQEPDKRPLQTDEAMSGDWTLPYGQWGFSFTTPYGLSARVKHARIIDTDGYLYRFFTLDPTQDDPNIVGKWNTRISGVNINFNKVNKPPQYLVFCWDSHIDKKTYETRVVFSPETWLRMKTPASQRDSENQPVWYDRMLIGLAPEGKVRLWLEGGTDPNLPIKPIKLETVSGDQLRLCKSMVRDKASYKSIKRVEEFIKDKTYPYGEW